VGVPLQTPVIGSSSALTVSPQCYDKVYGYAWLVCGRRRRHLQRRSQTTDPLYSASRFDDDEALDRQQTVPDSVIYVPTCSPSLKHTPQSLCSYHRYFRSRTGSGNDAIWPPAADRTPIYVAGTVGRDLTEAAGQTSFPLLVHPGSTLATPRFRSTAMTSPSPMSFRSADNLDTASADQSTPPPRQPVRADLVESIRRKRTTWTAAAAGAAADVDNERSETQTLCSCDEHQATSGDCSC